MKTNKDSWYFRNKEYAQQYQAEYRANNSEKFTAKSAKRRALLKGAIPEDISGQDVTQMEHLYKYAQALTEFSGVPHHVDHIVPLSKGGQHHPSNLRITTATYNEIKNGHDVQFDIDEDCAHFKAENDGKLVREATSSKSRCRAVICFETGEEYYSVTDCADKVGATRGGITKILNRHAASSFKGRHYYYKDESDQLDDLVKQWKYLCRNKIQCLETGEIFYTFKEAAEVLGGHPKILANYVKCGKVYKDKYTIVFAKE